MKKLDIQGIRTDWEAFEAAQKERWEKLPPGLYRCKVHDTVFDYDAVLSQNEPCWACLDEFTETL